jgi:hypothetical protein
MTFKNVWIASSYGLDQPMKVRACTTRAAALSWLAESIDERDWSEFYNAMPEDEREGLTWNREGMTPIQIIEAWVAPDGENSWGNDMLTFSVENQYPYDYEG